MAAAGVVTDIFTQGYVEVALLEEDGTPGRQRQVAETPDKIRRGDTVSLEPAEPWNDRMARIVYVMPVVFLILGAALPRQAALPDRLVIGGVLGALSFVVAWLMNRRARLRRRLAWRVTKVLRQAD